MNKTFINVLKLIENDLSNNSTHYKSSPLKTIIGQFQSKILDIRKKDEQVQVLLQSLTPANLKTLVEKLDLHLLVVPNQKHKLVSILNSLIIQEGKRKRFLEIANTLNVKKASGSSSKKKSSSIDIESTKKQWLTHNSLEVLAKEMENLSMGDLRAVANTWAIKGRSKVEIIGKIIDYIKKIKNLSKLGT